MRPRIGISLCLDERGRWKNGRDYHYIDAAYASAVERAGAAALYLPAQCEAVALVDEIDALLLPGGDDLLPAEPYPTPAIFDPVPESQLRFDRELLAAATQREIPVLAICYGMQLLALSRGGDLHYDIPTECSDAIEHQLDESTGRHPIRIAPESRLAAAIGEQRLDVNSLHHQAVANAGAGMRVCARSEDGLIEAIEAEDQPFCLGVQWHPEKLRACDPIFDAFVAACAAPPDKEY